MRRSKKAALTIFMRLSDLPLAGLQFKRLASAFLGPYKDKRVLAYLTNRPFISPKAEVRCRRLRVGRNVFVDDRVTIYCADGDGTVLIGEGAHLYRGTNIEVGSGGRVIIGADSHLQGPCDLKSFLGNLVIGSDVQIAPFCALSSYNHAFADLSRPIRQQGLTSRGDTVVEDDVWLGAGVKVLDGVRIGRGSVIGAGAVVTRNIPPYSIAVGAPALVIGKRGGRGERIEEAVRA